MRAIPSETNKDTHIEGLPKRKGRRTKLIEILEVDDHGGGVDVKKILFKEYYDMDEK